ncbi:MAG TPA: universal stress protein [Gemmatimonadaceae bacterium]|jgi:nucleotide-binding universal stress UspA family protein
MYSTIMVPTDGSGFDREAIRVALRIAERSEAKVRLVRVLATGSFFGMAAAAEGTSVAAEVVRSERDRALSDLYALAAECRATANADITVDLHAGPVADVLEGYARRHEVDLIVISTHGRSGISRMSLGSVTDSLIRHTSIPVLVVKPATSYLNPQVSDAFERIVVPLDGSTLAEQILPRVMTLATLEEAEITLLHVLSSRSNSRNDVADPDATWWDKETPAQEYLFRIAKKLRRKGAPVRTDIVVSENVPDAIGDFAAREKSDLIAIATHGRGGLARMLRGSVADAVMHSGRTSMLVFKPEKAGEKEEFTSVSHAGLDLIPA